jgi:hypothetical protein
MNVIFRRNLLGVKRKLIVVVLIGIFIRVLPIVFPVLNPLKLADIYYADTESAKAVLGLQNPYTYAYSTDAGPPNVYAYLPAVPFFFAPFQLLFGDVRYGSVFADSVTAFCCYAVARAINPRLAIYSALAAALLPTSVVLTSIIGNNVMVGTMFLALAVAFLFKDKYFWFGFFFGIGLATNQLLVLALPFLAFYLYERHRLDALLISVILALAVILPFYIAAPQRFFYDTVSFQFQRQLQPNGFLGLYSIVRMQTGISIPSWARILTVAVIGSIIFAYRRPFSKIAVLGETGIFMAVSAFVLPVNGFWSYYFPSMIISCMLLGLALQRGRKIPEARSPLTEHSGGSGNISLKQSLP